MRFLFVIIGLLVLLTPISAIAADGLVQCGFDVDDSGTVDPSEYCTVCAGFQLINNIINTILFVFVPLVAPIFIVIGGFFLMTAAGDPGRHEKGKTIITATIVGLLITYTAWAVVNTFLTFIGLVEWTGLTNGWWTIADC